MGRGRLAASGDGPGSFRLCWTWRRLFQRSWYASFGVAGVNGVWWILEGLSGVSFGANNEDELRQAELSLFSRQRRNRFCTGAVV